MTANGSVVRTEVMTAIPVVRNRSAVVLSGRETVG
jgi:hypothetical protein